MECRPVCAGFSFSIGPSRGEKLRAPVVVRATDLCRVRFPFDGESLEVY